MWEQGFYQSSKGIINCYLLNVAPGRIGDNCGHQLNESNVLFNLLASAPGKFLRNRIEKQLVFLFESTAKQTHFKKEVYQKELQLQSDLG